MLLSDMAGYYDKGTLDKINRAVNGQMTYQTDLDQYKVSELWESEKPFGDCEDYALTKLHKCLEAGIDIANLMLATCWVENGAYHCVLLVALDGSDYVLDNLSNTVYRPETASYKWDKRQSMGGSRVWVRYSPAG